TPTNRWRNSTSSWSRGSKTTSASDRPAKSSRELGTLQLVKQTRQFGHVTDIVRRQFHGDNLVRLGVNTEMQFAPASRRADTAFLIQPFALAVNLQAGAIDKEMQWLFATNRLWQDGQIGAPTAQRCVIGDSNIKLEHIGDRSQQAFGLTQRLVEHQAKCETRLDGCRRIDRLTAALAGGRRTPCRHGVFREPQCQASPPHQSSIALWPICHPISRLWKLVATVFVELVRHGFPELRGRNNWATLPAGRHHGHPSRNSPAPSAGPATG